jgi:hypothetical protein
MAQVRQNQGPPPRQRPPRPPRQGPQVKQRDGFDDEWVDRHVVILLSNGKELRGMLVDSRRYWLKIMDINKNTLYINKAYVIHIVPAS